ncbi:MAG: hypothetical protein M0Z70_04845 [Nitrospiraceae bacterium]|jgi:hypothetical protein|nr:hypothetical protein [Nitrospiraceae bacterium]
MNNHSNAAKKAWVTRKSPTYRARKTAFQSQKALEKWARENGWKILFLDADSGNPRTGIIDAMLVRILPKKPDCLDLKLVQLKAGSAGLKPREMKRLREAIHKLRVEHLVVLFDDGEIMFSPSEPV